MSLSGSRMKMAMSSGLRDVTRLRSTTTSSSAAVTFHSREHSARRQVPRRYVVRVRRPASFT